MNGKSNRDGVGIAEKIVVTVFRMISGNGRGAFSPGGGWVVFNCSGKGSTRNEFGLNV